MKKSLLPAALALAALGLFAGQKTEIPDGAKIIHNPRGGQWGKTPAVRLEPVRTIGDVDSEDEAVAFHMPSDLAVDKAGRIYILDTGNHRVQVFDAAGKFVKTIGRQGQGPGEFFMPGSLALDPAGMVYVHEAQSGRIQGIAPDGKVVRTLKLTEGSLGAMRLLDSGDFVLAAGGGMGLVSLSVGGPEEKALPPLLRIIDAKGAKIREFGRGADYQDPLVNQMVNQVLVAPGGGGSIYAVFPYQNRIEKFASDGRLLWRSDRVLDYSMEVKGRGDMKRESPSRGTVTVSVKMPELARCSSGAAVDGRGRLWVATLDRQLRKNEDVRVSRQISMGGGVTTGKEEAKGAVDLRTTDAYRLDVFSPEGVLLGSVPVSTFVDGVYIRGDRLFLMDKLRGVQFHEFRIR